MIKKSIFFSFLLPLCLSFSAYSQQIKVSAKDINVLADKGALLMDVQSFENVVYEAFFAIDSKSQENTPPVYINTYEDGILKKTLRLDLEGFITGELREDYSHYKHLHIFPLGKDEFIISVYTAYSDNRLGMFHIKNNEILYSKGFNLKAFIAYETQKYCYDGKDTIYIAFEGQNDFAKTKWDAYILAFDLKCNLVKAVSVYTKDIDEILGIAAVGNNIYFHLSNSSWSNQCIVQMDKNFNIKKTICNYYDKSDIRGWYLYSYDDCFYIKSLIRNDPSTYLSRYDSDGNLLGTYKISFKDSEENYYTMDLFFTPEGLTPLVNKYDNDSFWENDAVKNIERFTYFMDWNGNLLWQYTFSKGNNISKSLTAKSGSKFLCFDTYNHKTTGIGKVLYDFAVEEKNTDCDWVNVEKISTDFLQAPENPASYNSYLALNAEWNDKLMVNKIKVPELKFPVSLSQVQLNYVNTRPDDAKITGNVPHLPFSDR